MEIQRVLVISTGHLKASTRKELDRHAGSDSDRFNNGLPEMLSWEYGWMICAGGHDDPLTEFEDLNDGIRLAWKEKCDWIRFDADGDRVEEISYYGDGETPTWLSRPPWKPTFRVDV